MNLVIFISSVLCVGLSSFTIPDLTSAKNGRNVLLRTHDNPGTRWARETQPRFGYFVPW